MSNLTTNNTSLQEILAKVNALPEAGGGSGGAVETCTVKLTSSSGIAHTGFLFLVIDDNGNFDIKQADNMYVTDYVVNNVVCNSMCILLTEYGAAAPERYPINLSGLEYVGFFNTNAHSAGEDFQDIYVVTANPGGEALMDIY